MRRLTAVRLEGAGSRSPARGGPGSRGAWLEAVRLEGAGSRLEGTGCWLRLAEDLGRLLRAHQRPHLYRQLHGGQGGECRPVA